MLSVVGLTHKTAPLHVRERVSFGEADLTRALPVLHRLPSVREALLLSTCNRTEVYLVTSGSPQVSAVASVLGGLRSAPPQAFASFLALLGGEDAARHAVRVAAGLESMVVGEQQILSQVRRAFGVAREAGTSGPVLNRLMPLAIATGRRVRRETPLGRRPSSVPHAALALCRRLWRTTEGRSVLIVGAGEMAALAAKVFADGGVRIAAIANRTLETADTLAARYEAHLLPLDAITPALPRVDAVIVSVGAERPLLEPASFEAIPGRDEPLVVVDIGVPRGVDPGVASQPHVSLYDLDALAPDGPTAAVTPDDLADAEGIVEEAVEAFMRWLASRPAVPVIEALHHRAERIVDEELFRARARLRGLDERQRRAVRGVVEGALRKMLHATFVRLRAKGHDARVMALARELFELDGDGEEDRDA